jgi:hypothetical protein
MQRSHRLVNKLLSTQKRTAYHGTPPPEPKPDRLWSNHLGGVSLSVGFMGLGYWFLNERLKQAFWTKTKGTVESINDQQTSQKVMYSFALNNEIYDGSQNITNEQYKTGDIVDIFVDPKMPYKHNVLKKAPVTDVGAGAVLLTMGLYSLKKSLR